MGLTTMAGGQVTRLEEKNKIILIEDGVILISRNFCYITKQNYNLKNLFLKQKFREIAWY